MVILALALAAVSAMPQRPLRPGFQQPGFGHGGFGQQGFGQPGFGQQGLFGAFPAGTGTGAGAGTGNAGPGGVSASGVRYFNSSINSKLVTNVYQF